MTQLYHKRCDFTFIKTKVLQSEPISLSRSGFSAVMVQSLIYCRVCASKKPLLYHFTHSIIGRKIALSRSALKFSSSFSLCAYLSLKGWLINTNGSKSHSGNLCVQFGQVHSKSFMSKWDIGIHFLKAAALFIYFNINAISTK